MLLQDVATGSFVLARKSCNYRPATIGYGHGEKPALDGVIVREGYWYRCTPEVNVYGMLLSYAV